MVVSDGILVVVMWYNTGLWRILSEAEKEGELKHAVHVIHVFVGFLYNCIILCIAD